MPCIILSIFYVKVKIFVFYLMQEWFLRCGLHSFWGWFTRWFTLWFTQISRFRCKTM